MPAWAPDLGAIPAHGAAVVNLAERRDWPTRAGIRHAMLRNNSLAVLTVVNAPGGSVDLDPGERVDLDMEGARQLVLQTDAEAVEAGQVKVQLEVAW